MCLAPLERSNSGKFDVPLSEPNLFRHVVHGPLTALQGAGGYGKTTLAIALCHDDQVIGAFDAN